MHAAAPHGGTIAGNFNGVASTLRNELNRLGGMARVTGELHAPPPSGAGFGLRDWAFTTGDMRFAVVITSPAHSPYYNWRNPGCDHWSFAWATEHPAH